MLIGAAFPLRRLRPGVSLGVLSAVSASAFWFLAAVAPPAQAASPQGCTADFSPALGGVDYGCRDQGRPGRAKRPAARQVAGRPSCELTGQATFCVGSSPCWIVPRQHRSLYDSPATPAPTPGADWVVRACITFTGYWRVITTPFWQAPTPATLAVAARQAIGNLRLPPVTAASAPPALTLVNLDTWFAPATTVTSPVHGTSALGVVAVATATGFAVDPGDATPAFSCPPTATLNQTARCTHTYRRSSAGQTATTPDGKPGYQVRAWTTWRIDFLQGNNPITIPGAPTTINGPVTTRILPVAESQAIVVD
jgi:hypothetical protein